MDPTSKAVLMDVRVAAVVVLRQSATARRGSR
jgi:hypothetical protein